VHIVSAFIGCRLSIKSLDIHIYICILYCCYICRLDDQFSVKIADFGLTREVYSRDYYKVKSCGKLPVKWMALESLNDKISNEKTDVVS